MKHLIPITILILLLAACAPAASPDRSVSSTPEPNLPQPTDEVPMNPPANTPPDQPYLPKLGDANLDKGNLYLDSVEILILESYPVQIMLSLQGNLPTPCHQLRVEFQPPDEQNRIFVEVYSVSDPDMLCVQVLEPFDTNIPLGSFPSGHYTVWVNGKKVGEFDA